MPTLGPLSASLPDLLRLLSVPVFGWAAYRDVRTRRVRNRTWYPLLALAVVLLVWDAWRLWTASGPFATADWRVFALPAAVGVGIVVPLAYAFWRVGGFGGADAKALLVLALLFPVFPEYDLARWTLPAVRPPLETFSFTVLTNTVAFGVVYPLALALRNAARGRLSARMFVGHAVAVTDLPERHGRMLDDAEGTTGGLDLDALRMYLRWRGTTLAALRERPDWHRDPASLPAEPNDPTDGAVTADAEPPDGLPGEDDGLGITRAAAAGATDGGDAADDAPGGDGDGDEQSAAAGDERESVVEVDDPWGAAAFLDAIEGTAYGTTPESLREGLEAVAERDTVLVSPGIPFVVPMFLGLVAALTVGDVLFWLLEAVGAAPA